MPTLRVWIFYGKDSAQEYWKRNTAVVPGYGRVQVFQKKRNAVIIIDKEHHKDRLLFHRYEVFSMMIIH